MKSFLIHRKVRSVRNSMCTLCRVYSPKFFKFTSRRNRKIIDKFTRRRKNPATIAFHNFLDRALVSEPDNSSGRPITKSTSTPASLQTIVRMHAGNNSSLHHKVSVKRNANWFLAEKIKAFIFLSAKLNS